MAPPDQAGEKPMPDANDSPYRNNLCGHPGPREELVETAGLDRFERAALEVIRLILSDMAGHRPRYAPDTAQLAQARFGWQRGGAILAGLTAFAQTMSLSRRDTFHYSNPYCPGCCQVLTQGEGHLLRLLHHMRRGQRGRAMAHALILCEARPVAALLDAASDLASLVPPGTDPQ